MITGAEQKMGKHIYIHIPFCARKCAYCSFYSEIPSNKEILFDYKEALIREIKAFTSDSRIIAGYQEDEDIDTVYFGGGTPSVLPPNYLTEVLSSLAECFKLDISDSKRTEVTVEVNPFTADKAKLMTLREGGFNRISIGVQSLDDKVLKILGRLHDAKIAERTLVEAQEAGFTNLSADLIIGVPGQTVEGVVSDAERLVHLGAKHVSSYSLSIEEGTPFEALYKDLEKFVPQETERAMYHGLRASLRKHNFTPYEISNSALPGFESHHNNCYWRASEYFAFGAGAHGYVGGVRFGHPDNFVEYIRLLKDETSVNLKDLTVIEERLDDKGKMREYMMLAFRRAEGVDLDYFRRKFNVDAEKEFKSELDSLCQRDLIIKRQGHYCYTEHGLNFANNIFEEFV